MIVILLSVLVLVFICHFPSATRYFATYCSVIPVSVCDFSHTDANEVIVICFQHSAAVAAGFRNSGLSVSKRHKIIAVSYYYVMANNTNFCSDIH